MYKAKVTSKGQVTIPVEVRKAMGLKPGGKVAFFAGDDGEFVLRRVRSVMELEGLLAGLRLPKSDEEINEQLHRHAFELDAATKSDARASDDEAA